MGQEFLCPDVPNEHSKKQLLQVNSGYVLMYKHLNYYMQVEYGQIWIILPIVVDEIS